MPINLIEYYAEQELAAENQKKSLREEIDRLRTAIVTLKAESEDTIDLIRRNQAAGIDVNKLKERFVELQKECAAIEERVVAHRKELDSISTKQNSDLKRMGKMARALKVVGCIEAVEVTNIDECIAELPVGDIQTDTDGRPIRCSISIGRSETIPIAVRASGAHYLKTFRPPSLQWLPIAIDTSTEEVVVHNSHEYLPVFPAYLQRESRTLILARTMLPYLTNSGERARWPEEEDFSDLAHSLSTDVRAMIKDGGEEIDLDKQYPDNTVLTHVRSKLVPLITSKRLFVPNTEKLTSSDVYKHVRADWDAFVSAQWSSSVKGALALLKYHLENREVARFWCTEFKDNYGFRLRTRDHDWLVGEVYIHSGGQPTTDKVEIRVHTNKYSDKCVASVGRMSIIVTHSKE